MSKTPATKTTRAPSLLLTIAALATLLSGAAGLSYEVLWSRMLVIPLGNSADATTLVLCAFMLGMAAGAKIIGGLADRMSSPLRIYVAAELLLGLYAIAVPFVVPALTSSQAFAGNFDSAPVKVIFRFVVASSLVALPAIFMGAAVPVLVRALSNAKDQFRKRVGLLYGANTIGGAAGAAVCGFAAIPTLGLMATSFAAAGLSIAAALLVLMASRLPAEQTDTASNEESTGTEPPPVQKWAALAAAATGGMVVLGAEVVWARVLTFVFGHDTYAFAILLVIVLLGLGLGGIVHRALAHKNQAMVNSLALTGLGLTTLLSFLITAQIVIHLGRDPFGIASSATLSTSLWKEFWRELTFAPLLVFVPAVLAGISLPAACAAFTGPLRRAGNAVGTVFLVNGIAAAAGTVLTGTVLIPRIGIQPTLILLGLLAAIVGLAILVLAIEKRTPRALAGPAAVGVAVLVLALVTPSGMPKAMFKEAVGARYQDVVYYKEGRIGTVSVTVNKINKERQLFINAVNEVTTRLVHDQSFKLLGHLAPLLHPKPEKGLMICFGAGMAAGGAITHPLERLDIVDLSPSVWGAAGHWKRENNEVLKDKRVVPHVDDGRQFLLRSNDTYDVMMIDSTHPKAVDSWILYTSGFYELVKAHLDEEGIVVQWLPLHGLSEKEFQVIVHTFLEVFPDMTMWVNVGFETYGKAAYAKLVGTHKPLEIDYRELARRIEEPQIARDLAKYGMDSPFEILDSFLADARAIQNWVKEVPVQTDDRPFVSYITEHSAGRRMDAAALIPLRTSVIPLLYNMGEDEAALKAFWHGAHEANGYLMAGMLDHAARVRPAGKKIAMSQKRYAGGKAYYLAFARMHKDDPEKLFRAASLLGNQGFTDDTIRLYRDALSMAPGNQLIRLNLALALLDKNEVEEAHNLLVDVVEAEPDSALANYNYGVAQIDQENAGEAVIYLTKAVNANDKLWGARLALANAYRMLGRLDKAKAQLQYLTANAPWLEDAWDALGLVEADKKNWMDAARLHQKALFINPYRSDFHYNMGVVLEKQQRYKEAAGAYQAALTIDERDAEARNNLGLIYGSAGMIDQAIIEHRKALDIEPHFPAAAFNLGLAYKAKGFTMQAVEAFTIALELNPDLTEAANQLKELGVEKVKIEVEETPAHTTAETAE